jgi:hypothetical protein
LKLDDSRDTGFTGVLTGKSAPVAGVPATNTATAKADATLMFLPPHDERHTPHLALIDKSRVFFLHGLATIWQQECWF